MAIVINNTPVPYASIHGDLLYTVYNSVNVSQPGYKYICDVYINGVMKYRGKVFPNPVSLQGIFNIGQIVRSFIATQLNPGTGLRSQEFASGDFYLDVVCQFGEEYGGTLYTNLTTDSSRRFYNHYNGRLLSTQTILSSFLDKPATNRPYDNRVQFTDAYCFVPYFPTTTAAIPIQIIVYGGGTYNTTITPTAASSLQQLNFSPTAINLLFASAITQSTPSYTVSINGVVYKFIMCNEVKYTNYTLHFFNQLGGFESVNFQKVSRKTYEITKHDFQQLPYRIDNSGMASYSSSKVLYDTVTTYASQFKEKLLLNTDILTDIQYQWLKELVLSPIVYIEQSGYLVPVKITDNNYEEKKFVNDKITNLTINIEFGELYNTQYR